MRSGDRMASVGSGDGTGVAAIQRPHTLRRSHGLQRPERPNRPHGLRRRVRFLWRHASPPTIRSAPANPSAPLGFGDAARAPRAAALPRGRVTRLGRPTAPSTGRAPSEEARSPRCPCRAAGCEARPSPESVKDVASVRHRACPPPQKSNEVSKRAKGLEVGCLLPKLCKRRPQVGGVCAPMSHTGMWQVTHDHRASALQAIWPAPTWHDWQSFPRGDRPKLPTQWLRPTNPRSFFVRGGLLVFPMVPISTCRSLSVVFVVGNPHVGDSAF